MEVVSIKTTRKSHKFLNYEDRKEIERMNNRGERVVKIASHVGVHRATIYKELKRGGIPYQADRAQRNLYEQPREIEKADTAEKEPSQINFGKYLKFREGGNYDVTRKTKEDR